MRRKILLAIIFLIAHVQVAFAEAGACGAIALGNDGKAVRELQQKCKSFQDKWGSELRLQRNPNHLAMDLETHADKVSANLQNIECIESLTHRAATLKENELQELRKRNSLNISNALQAGQERARLFREVKDTYQKLRNALVQQNQRNSEQNRPQIYKACGELLEERLKRILKMDQKPKEKPPSEYDDPESAVG